MFSLQALHRVQLRDGVCEQIDGEGGTSGLDHFVQKASIRRYDEGGTSGRICVDTNFVNVELAGTKINVDGGMSNQVCMEPNFPSVSETSVRYWATKLTSKDLEVLKACKVVVEKYQELKEMSPKITNWDDNFERKFGVWKITHGRFLNLKETCRPKTTKENGLKDFCLIKGLIKQNEIWEGGLQESLESKESKVKDIYDRLKTSKSKKKKLELLRMCQETLVEGIAKPKTSQEMLEQELFERLRSSLNKMAQDGRLPTLKTTNWKMTPPSPRKTTPTRKMSGKMTKLGRNSPLVPSVARKLGMTVVTRAKHTAEQLQRTHLHSAQTEASKFSSKPVLISSSAVTKPPHSTPVHRAGPPMGGEEGTADRALGGRLANQSRGMLEELPINSKD